jgi:metal-responsive CopG/Arc/MetJ family transcriptional regulator
MENTMAQPAEFDPIELVASPMVSTCFLLPRILLDEIDRAAVRDDASAPNRSSVIRRALIGYLRREAAR